MAGASVKFRHVCIDPDPPGAHHDITLITDVNGDGRNDIIIGGKQGDVNLFWYENPSWTRHDMAHAPQLEAGGVLLDVNRDGRLDVVVGQQISGNELYWFEAPPDPTQRWPRHLIEDRFIKYHDQAVGDVDGDGQPEIVAVSQKSRVLFYYDIPADPYVEPWPQSRYHCIAEQIEDLEGLVVVDIDGDGRNEVIAGPHIYRPGPQPDAPWTCEPLGLDFLQTRVAVADLDGDGRLEMVISEAERNPGRLAWCAPPDWKPHILRDDLFHAHSLAIADFNGDGRPDIFAAEMGLGRNPNPRMFVYVNRGGGRFEEVLFQQGIPTHEAKVGDLTGDGRPDIVGKPYNPERHIDVWFNET